MKFYLNIFFIGIIFLTSQIIFACNVNGVCPKLGDPCSPTILCSPGLFCNTANNTNMFCDVLESCVPQSIESDTCSQSGYICVNNDKTNTSSGVCLSFENQRIASSPCKTSSNCNNQICSNYQCLSNSVSTLCFMDTDCSYGQFCQYVATTSSSIGAIGIMGGIPGMGNTCVSKYTKGSLCSGANQCQEGLSCINGTCLEIFSGLENDSCYIPSIYSPAYNPCSKDLICDNGKCVKYVENTPCNSTYNTCKSFETCQCTFENGTEVASESGVCKLRYNLDDDCKQASINLATCAKTNQVFIQKNYIRLLKSCSQQLCSYADLCIKKGYDTCYQESYGWCPSGNYTSIPNEDSSNSLSSSSSNSNSSSNSTSNSSNSSNSSSDFNSSTSSSDDVNSSIILKNCYFFTLILVFSLILFINTI